MHRHVLGNGRVFATLFEQNLVLGQLFVVLSKHVVVFLLEELLDGLPGPDILELAQKIEGRLRRIELLREGVSDQVSHRAVNMVDALLEVLELGLPFLLVGLFEYVVRELLELLDLLPDGVDLVVNLLGTTGDLLEVWAENGEELLDDDEDMDYLAC